MLPRKRAPIHPGEILLEEFLNPLQISQGEFANHLGGSWSQPKVSAIVSGKRRITEAIALDFSDALGTSPEFWVSLQARYDLWHELQKHKKIPLLPIIRRRIGKKRELARRV
jgi:addiction module HigA family antidote